jgi:hypothetical protein
MVEANEGYRTPLHRSDLVLCGGVRCCLSKLKHGGRMVTENAELSRHAWCAAAIMATSRRRCIGGCIAYIEQSPVCSHCDDARQFS